MDQEYSMVLLSSGNELVVLGSAGTYTLVDIKRHGPLLGKVKSVADKMGITVSDGPLEGDAAWHYYEEWSVDHIAASEGAGLRSRTAIRNLLSEVVLSFAQQHPDNGENVTLRLRGETIITDIVRQVESSTMRAWG